MADNSNVSKAIGVVILVILLANLVGPAFNALFGINTTETPTWVKTTLQVITGAVLVLLLWRAGGGGR